MPCIEANIKLASRKYHLVLRFWKVRDENRGFSKTCTLKENLPFKNPLRGKWG